VLVVEVMSPGSVTADQTDKPAEYAAAGIEHYWRVESTAPSGGLSVFCYRLDPTTGVYATAGVHSGTLAVIEPIGLTIDLAALL
jgi:Uma2 family endonuclease